jgi:hypothetical protein
MEKFMCACGILLALGAGAVFAPRVLAQGAEPGRERPDRAAGKRSTGTNPPKPIVKTCGAGEIIVHCGMPECNISLDNNPPRATGSSGELRLPAASGTHVIIASKPYHESVRSVINLACGEAEIVEVRPKAKTVALKIRTSLPQCDIYLNNSPSPLGRSDAQGIFNYQAIPSLLLIEARKKGYLSELQRINIAPEGGLREITLVLQPIKASLNISANVEGARARVDGDAATQPVNERLSLTPGQHRITVDALGYAPATFEINPLPDEKITKSITLERLPTVEIIRQAEKLYNQRAYADVLTLCKYVFESDGNNPAAHRLAGLTYASEQDYANSAPHLEKALSANEIIRLQVRRHPRESFDLNKGHDACDAMLILNKNEVEFQGLRDATENYKVPYSQIEVVGIQLKKNAALYLGTKIMVARGKRKEYNFYSFDKELSQSSRVYLEMLQRLLRAH